MSHVYGRERRENAVAGRTFDKLLADELRDPEFARGYAAELARINAIDAVINGLSDLLEESGMNKTQLARAIGSQPSVVRRLLTAQTVNPTLSTVAELAAALGWKVTLTPMSDEERKRITEPMIAGCA
jgi:DNA-binding phage protein